MKRSLIILTLVCVLFVPVKAGETNGPPSPLPSPCTENCPQSATVQSTAATVLQIVIDTLLKLRP